MTCTACDSAESLRRRSCSVKGAPAAVRGGYAAATDRTVGRNSTAGSRSRVSTTFESASCTAASVDVLGHVIVPTSPAGTGDLLCKTGILETGHEHNITQRSCEGATMISCPSPSEQHLRF